MATVVLLGTLDTKRTEDAAYVLERTSGVVGFYGASSMERLPTEVAITENTQRFKAVRLAGA